MNYKKIFIASVLKPVDDVRHFDKLACSLAKANKYQIFILGKGSIKKTENDLISFWNTGYFKRKSFHRLIVQITFLRKISALKPDLIIITSLELLPLASLFKKWFRYKLVYDVQENYLSNIRYQNEYPTLEKLILIPIINLTQRIFHRRVDHFLLAEKSYSTEVANLGNRYTILENKTGLSKIKLKVKKWDGNEPLILIFSGTISEYSGIKIAIEIFEKIQKHVPSSRLKVIGCYHDLNLQKFLKSKAEENPSIELYTDSTPIEHDLILQAITTSHLGMISYKPNETNKKRVPTKLFEYASYGLPYLIDQHPYWLSRSQEMGGAIPIDIGSFDVEKAIKQYRQLLEWDRKKSLWLDEEVTLINLIKQLIK
ncbi:MAG: glycosyltransferase involved in cell wall biosynthesis [Cyclobacteriaceae bacterium]